VLVRGKFVYGGAIKGNCGKEECAI